MLQISQDEMELSMNHGNTKNLQDRGNGMQQVIREYGTAVLGAVGATLLLAVIGKLLLSSEGILAQMILLWGNGGC